MQKASQAAYSPHPIRWKLLAGLGMILLGLLLWMLRAGHLHNWWASFILLPAAGSFLGAYLLLRRTHHIGFASANLIFGGTTILAVALIFLLGLSWRTTWPVFVLLPGLQMYTNGSLRRITAQGSLGRNFLRPWWRWLGACTTLLGLGFLIQFNRWLDLTRWLHNWWAVCILLAALGGVWIGLHLLRSEGRTRLFYFNTQIVLFLTIPGMLALLRASWDLITPLIVMGIGLLLLLEFIYPPLPPSNSG